MAPLTPQELELLAEKWLNGTITPAEEAVFNTWYEQQPDAFLTVDSADNNLEDFRARILAKVRQTIGEKEAEAGTVVAMPRYRWKRWTVAACLIGLLGVGGYKIYERYGSPRGEAFSTAALASKIKPGTNGAVLTIAGGQKVILDSVGSGAIPAQGVALVKNGNGQLAYISSTEKPTSVVYNTLATGRGNQYQLVLSDGTKVWLNAASSITYPAAFSGATRAVTITGEAYFEVVHREDAPFVVQVPGQTITDVGTHFNINAYTDEPSIKTTLLEGAVRMGGTVVRAGQEASVSGQGLVTVRNDADLDLAVAWKNGMQSYSGADLQTVMRQVARWYYIDVSYQGNIPDRTFSGDIPRSANLSEVLKLFEATHIHFAIDPAQRKLTILP